MRISFIGIGAQKCASSWVHDILADHPEVAVPRLKEVDFFSNHFENGYRWYENKLVPRPGAIVAGENSPSYMHEPAVPERVFGYRPDMKIIVSLRDPVERVLSQHRHMVGLGRIPSADLTLETALATNPTYIDQSLYHRHLRRWTDRFGLERVHVIFMEDIRADDAAVARDLYGFLGIRTDHIPALLGQVKNPSHVPRNQALEERIRWLRRSAIEAGAAPAWRWLGNIGLRRLYRTVNPVATSGVIPAPSPETLQKLREGFADDVAQLSQLLHRDLTTWLPR
jgi:Sulfotransferase family